VDINGLNIRVKGPKGEMQREFSSMIGVGMENGQVTLTRKSDRPAERAMHGTTRALLANMILGVSAGFERVLEIEGVGYRAEMKEKTLVLFMGFSHPVEMEPPAGITFDVEPKARKIFVRGIDKEQVGQVAANIRNVRPPEPYHGKGLHYLGEKIRRKAGKAGKAAQ
jgi:large subunit ribosomal protein L6